MTIEGFEKALQDTTMILKYNKGFKLVVSTMERDFIFRDILTTKVSGDTFCIKGNYHQTLWGSVRAIMTISVCEDDEV